MNYFKHLFVLFFLSVAIVSCGDSDSSDTTDSDTSSSEETSNTDTTNPSVPEETSNTDTTAPIVPENTNSNDVTNSNILDETSPSDTADSSPSIPENTNSTNDAEALKCINGVYSPARGVKGSRYYEVEVSYSPNEVIFLFQTDSRGAKICTSYTSPEFQTSENQITLSSRDMTSVGRFFNILGIYDDVIFTKNTEGTCSKFGAIENRNWSLDLYFDYKRVMHETSRSFSEIKSICDSLSSQE